MLRDVDTDEAARALFQSPSEVSDVLRKMPNTEKLHLVVSIPFRGFRRAEKSKTVFGEPEGVSIPFRGFRRAEEIFLEPWPSDPVSIPFRGFRRAEML